MPRPTPSSSLTMSPWQVEAAASQLSMRLTQPIVDLFRLFWVSLFSKNIMKFKSPYFVRTMKFKSPYLVRVMRITKLKSPYFVRIMKLMKLNLVFPLVTGEARMSCWGVVVCTRHDTASSGRAGSCRPPAAKRLGWNFRRSCLEP